MFNLAEDLTLPDLVEKTPNRRMHNEPFPVYKERMRQRGRAAKATSKGINSILAAILQANLYRRIGGGPAVHHRFMGQRRRKLKGWQRDPRTGRKRTY